MKSTCQYCCKTYGTRLGLFRHLSRHCRQMPTELEDRWLTAVGIVYDQRLNSRIALEDLYVKQRLSISEIAGVLGCDHLLVHRAFLRHGITKRSQSASRQISQPKIELTCLERYGKINPLSSGTYVFRNRNETVRERYGVENVFQSPDIQRRIIAQMRNGGYAKRRKTFMRRFGVTTNLDRPGIREKAVKSLTSNRVKGRYISRLNTRCYEVLRSRNIEFEPEFILRTEHRTFAYDVKVNNTLLELNGDHWHANPARFKADDLVMIPGGSYLARDKWQSDHEKHKAAQDRGFTIKVLWESDLKSDFETKVLQAVENAR